MRGSRKLAAVGMAHCRPLGRRRRTRHTLAFVTTVGDDAAGTLVERAEGVARRAHGRQVDKAGLPYIGHPERVAAAVAGDPVAQAVAWLHDVVEDTDVTLADLRDAGLPERVVVAVDAITRRDEEPRDDYYARVANDPIALRVKRADIADNSGSQRMGLLDEATQARLRAKYAHALATLDRLAAD